MAINPTEEQRKIIEADLNRSDVLLVSAYAGTGKTATLKMFAERHADKRILYLAFNRAIAREAKQKFADLPHVEARTIHSLAFRYRGYRYKSRLGNLRVMDVLNNTAASTFAEAREALYALGSYNASDVRQFEDLKINTRDGQELVRRLSDLWNGITDPEGKIQVPHDVYLKQFQLDEIDLDYDIILVDEAQDLTNCVIDIVLRQTSKKVFVGDSYQQIYSWKGAVDSLPRLSERAQHLHLTQSFRCPESAANIANRYLRLLGASRDFHGLERPKQSNAQHAYIARTNAMVFDYAAGLDMQKYRVHFLGGFDSYNFRSIVDARHLLDNQLGKMSDPFMKKFRSAGEFEKYVEKSEEQDLKTRLEIARNRSDAKDVYYRLRTGCVANRKDAGIILTTAHKVKGQEFRSVKLADDFVCLEDLIGKAKKQGHCDVRAEEFNLLYVAITRTQKDIGIPPHFVPSGEILDRFNRLMRKRRIEFV